MNKNINEFINQVNKISLKLSYLPVLEHSYKFTKPNDINKDRCVMIISSNKFYIKKEELFEFLNYLNFPNKFNIFINNYYKNYIIKNFIIGLDLKTKTYKLYLIVDKSINDINYMFSMEINNNNILFKKYEPFLINKMLFKNLLKIYPKYENKNNLLKFSNLVNSLEWGYLRYNYKTKQYYGLDIYINKNNINQLLININNIFGFTNNYNLINWLNLNNDKNVMFISLCYRNNKLDFCIYYRNNLNNTHKINCNCLKHKLESVYQYYEDDDTINMIKDTNFYGKDKWHTNLNFKLNNKIINGDKLLLNSNKITNKDHILDWGCGLGEFLKNIYVKYNSFVYGINISEKQINFCKNKFNILKIPRNKSIFIKTNGIYIPIANNKINYIFSQEAIVHQPDKLKLFNEFYRILKKGGTLMFQDWFLIDSNKSKKTNLEYKTFLETKENYLKYLSKAGFENVQIFKPVINDELESIHNIKGFTINIIYCNK